MYSFRLIVKRKTKEITALGTSLSGKIFSLYQMKYYAADDYHGCHREDKRKRNRREFISENKISQIRIFLKNRNHALQESPWIFLDCFSMWIEKDFGNKFLHRRALPYIDISPPSCEIQRQQLDDIMVRHCEFFQRTIGVVWSL